MPDAVHNGQALLVHSREVSLSGKELPRKKSDRPIHVFSVLLAQYGTDADIRCICVQDEHLGVNWTLQYRIGGEAIFECLEGLLF